MGNPNDGWVDLNLGGAGADDGWTDLDLSKPVEPRSLLKEVPIQVYAGATIDLPKQFGQALQWFSDPGKPIYNWGKEIQDWAQTREASEPDLAPQVEGRGLLGSALSTGARALAPSTAVMIPAALGAAAAPVVGAAALTGAAAGGAAGAFGLFGASQAQDTKDKLVKAGVSESEANTAGWINLMIEGGGETLGTIAGLKLFGLAGKALVKGASPAANAITGATSGAVLAPFLKQAPKTLATEMGTEFGQNYGEAWIEQKYGAPAEPGGSPWEQGKQGAIAALGMTILLTPFGLASMAHQAKRNERRAKALEDPQTPVLERMAAATVVFNEINAVDKDAAKAWSQNSTLAIVSGSPIVLDETTAQPGEFAGMSPNEIQGELARRRMPSIEQSAADEEAKTAAGVKAIEDAQDIDAVAKAALDATSQPIGPDVGGLLQSQAFTAEQERELITGARNVQGDEAIAGAQAEAADLASMPNTPAPWTVPADIATGKTAMQLAFEQADAKRTKEIGGLITSMPEPGPGTVIPTTPVEAQALTPEHLAAARNLTRSAETRQLIDNEILLRENRRGTIANQENGSGAADNLQVRPTVDGGVVLPAVSPGAARRPVTPPPAAPAKPTGPVLQNRNRAAPAMVAQMRNIAANPNPGKLSFSRDFTTGSPTIIPDGATIPADRLGNKEKIITAGREIPVQYAVVEAQELLPSHNVDGIQNEGYGAGIVGKYRVVAGNGRAAGLQAAYTDGNTPAYIKGIIDDAKLHGVSTKVIEGMKQPVLVRLMADADVTANLGDETNVAAGAELTPAEQAATDARRIDISAIEFGDNGEMSPRAVKQFVNGMPETERAGLLDDKGEPTRQAYDRLTNAAFMEAYGDPELVALQAQATDTEARTIISGMVRAAGAMARLKDAGDFDFRSVVIEAAKGVVNAKRAGASVSRYAAQGDLDMHPESNQVLQFFAENVKSAVRIGDGLIRLAVAADKEANLPSTDIFGTVQKRTRAQLLENLDDTERPKDTSKQARAGNAGPDAGGRGPDAEGQAGVGAAAQVGPAQAPGQTNARAAAEHINANREDVDPNSDTFPNGAPKDKAEYIDGAAYEKSLHNTYFGEGRALQSRTTPQTAPIPPVGSWKIADHDGPDGHEIEQLVEVPVDNLEISEDTGPEKRADVERYAKWWAEGQEPPPIHVVQHNKGALKLSDHRRVLAAKVLGKKTIKAWVSRTTTSTRPDYTGPTGMTYELAEAGKVPIAIAPARDDFKIFADDQRMIDKIREDMQAEGPAAFSRKQAYNPDQAGFDLGETPQAAGNRGDVGRSLTKEQRKKVLETLVDVYKQKGAELEDKGDDKVGYVYSPHLFERSDITGAMVRYHVTLPDGKIAHPTELFPDYTQSHIDAALAAQRYAEQQQAAEDKSRADKLDRRKAGTIEQANKLYWEQQRGSNIKPEETQLLTDGTSFIRSLKANSDKDLASLGDKWQVRPAGRPALDLSPISTSQQEREAAAAEKAKAESEAEANKRAEAERQAKIAQELKDRQAIAADNFSLDAPVAGGKKAQQQADIRSAEHQMQGGDLFSAPANTLSSADLLRAAAAKMDEAAGLPAVAPKRTNLTATHPNVVVRDIRGFNAEKMGDLIEPYDGTEEGARAAAKRIEGRMADEFPDASHIQSRIGATDENGKPKWAISPNLAHIKPVDTAEGAYIWGDTDAVKPAAPIAAAEEPTEAQRANYARQQELMKSMPQNVGKLKAEGRVSAALQAKMDELDRLEKELPQTGDAWQVIMKEHRGQYDQNLEKWRAEQTAKAKAKIEAAGFTIGQRVKLYRAPMFIGAPPTSYEGVIRVSKNGNVSVHTGQGAFDLFRNGWEPVDDRQAALDVPEPAAPPALTGEPVAATLASHDALIERARIGEATPEELKDGFERAVQSKAELTAELDKLTKEQISQRIGTRYANEKKSSVVRMAYQDVLSDFALDRVISYMMGSADAHDNAIRKMVEATTAKDIEDYSIQIRKRRLERAKQVEGFKKALTDPQTLDDFEKFVQIRKGGEASLTPAQRERFDELRAEAARAERDQRMEQRATIRAAAEQTTGTIIETKHTRDGYPLFVVQLGDRVSRESYIQLLGGAKRMGGWYSKFRGNGAVPGFQFKDRESAEAFQKLAGGDTAAATEQAGARQETRSAEKSDNAVERLNTMADTLEERANESLNADRKTNTARRAAQAGSAEAVARYELTIARTMRNIAEAITAGTAKHLDLLRTKVQVEMLNQMVRRAHNEAAIANAKAAGGSTYEVDQARQKAEDAPATAADIHHAEFPEYTAWRGDIAQLGRRLSELEGSRQLGERILKFADDSKPYVSAIAKNPAMLEKVGLRTQDGALARFGSKDDVIRAWRRSPARARSMPAQLAPRSYVVILTPAVAKERGFWAGVEDTRLTLPADLAEAALAKASIHNGGSRWGDNVRYPYFFDTVKEERARLAAMGVESAPVLRAALREFVKLRAETPKADKVKQLERALAGNKGVGVDFFPTPRAVAADLVRQADIRQGMDVLEPEAGNGNIADAIMEAHPEANLDTVEQSGTLREILVAKGYTVVGQDFTDYSGKQYDRIIMNPPFSNSLDIEHVRHAYDMLKPGGRIVAIMGEGAFSRGDKKATAFRDWLEQLNGSDEKLPAGTFLDPSLPNTTGVNARVVTIDKPENALSSPATAYNVGYEVHQDKRRFEAGGEQSTQGQLDLHAAEAVPGSPVKRLEKVIVEPERVGQHKIAFNRIRSPGQAASVFQDLNRSPREKFQVLGLDKNDKPIAFFDLFAGTLTQTSVYPREVWTAIYQTPGIKSVWIAHQHPSGVAEASHADRVLTRSIQQALTNDIGVALRGHLIVTNDKTIDIGPGGQEHIPVTVEQGESRYTLPILERMIVKQEGARDALSSPSAVRDFMRNFAPGETGLLVLNAQNGATGWWPMSLGQMSKLRTGDVNTGMAALMRAVGRGNIAAAIAYAPPGTSQQAYEKAFQNVGSALMLADVKMLDALQDDGAQMISFAERGASLTSGGTFFSQAASPWYYSALARSIDKVGTKSAPVSGWKSYLQGLVNKGTVKQAELDATGINDWLDTMGREDPAREWAAEGQRQFEAERPYTVERRGGEDGGWYVVDKNGKAVDDFEPTAAGKKAAESTMAMRSKPMSFGPVKVTKEQVQAFMEQGGVKVTERVLGGERKRDVDQRVAGLIDQRNQFIIDYANHAAQNGGNRGEVASALHTIVDDPMNTDAWAIVSPYADRSFDPNAMHDFKDDIAYAQNELLDDSSGNTKFATHQEPGAVPGSYRELVLTLPFQDTVSAETEAAARRELAAVGGSPAEVERAVAQMRAQRMEKRQDVFSSGHFPDAGNYLAHTRVNDRMVPIASIEATMPELAARLKAEGRNKAKLLFVEEIQSDRAQKGRTEGFTNTKRLAEVRARLAAMRSLPSEGKWTPELEKEETALIGERDRLQEQRIAPAPFVTKTDSWTTLVLKRLLRYAAEGEYDAISWTTGRQQFDRWGSEEIAWVKHGDGWQVSAKEQRGGNAGGIDIEGAARARGILKEETGLTIRDKVGLRVAVARVLSRENNAQAIDKVTNRVWDRMQTEDAGTSLPRKEGMEEYYDKITPKVAAEVAKKVGGGKVVDLDLSAPYKNAGDRNEAVNTFRQQMLDKYGDGIMDRMTPEERAQLKSLEAGTQIKQQAIEITPAMREKIMAGLPLFNRQRQAGAQRAGAVERQLAEPIAKLKVPVTVWDTVQQARDATGVNIPETGRAMYHGDEMHLFADRLHSQREAEEAFWHEVSHAGLNHLYGTGSLEYEEALTDIARQNRTIRMNAQMWRGRYGQDALARAKDYGMTDTQAKRYVLLQSIDEALADMAMTNQHISGLKPFLAAVGRFLHSIGLHKLADAMENMTDAEALRLIARSRAAVMDGGTHIGTSQTAPAYQILSYAKDHEGMPLLQHGTIGLVEPTQWDTVGDVKLLDHVIAEKGNDVGIVSLGWRGDQITQLENILTFAGGRERGIGSKVLDMILTHNDPGTTLWVHHVMPEARQWWINRGAQVFQTEEGEDATITKAEFDAAAAETQQRGDRRNAGTPGEAQTPTAFEKGQAGSRDTGSQQGDQAVARVAAALESFDSTGEIQTAGDLVDEIDGILAEEDLPNADKLDEAVAAYRDEQQYDRELAGRGDMDAAEEAFVGALKSYLRTNAATPSAFARQDQTEQLSSRAVSSRQAAVSESGPDSYAADAEALANFFEGKAFQLHGLSGLDVPSQGEVLHRVLSLGKDSQVVDAVVKFAPRAVVNVLSGEQLTPKVLLHDRSVLKNLLSADRDGSVTTAVDIANTLVRAIASVAAERVGTLGVPARAQERSAAPAANYKDLSVSAHGENIPQLNHIGNRGTFDPNSPDIRFSRAAPQFDGKWNENAARLVPRGKIEWTDAKGGLGASSGMIDGKLVAHLRKVSGGYVAKIEGWQWAVTQDSGTARFNQIPGDKITNTPAKLFKTLAQAKRAAQSVLARPPAFSQSPAATMRSIIQSPKIGNMLTNMLDSPKTTGWLNGINTQYHKAEMLARQGKPQYKAVFNKMQEFLNDISAFAGRAEAEAPGIFRELKGMGPSSIKAYFKGAASEADIQAVGPWLNHGTLYGKGNPLEGRVWTDEQLRGKFVGIDTANPGLTPLTDKQIGLYHQARAALDMSLEDSAKALIYRHVSRYNIGADKEMNLADNVANVKDAIDGQIEKQNDRLRALQEILDDPEAEFGDEDPRDAAKRLTRQIESAQAEIKELEELIKTVEGVEKRANDLIEHGYMPLMRFGNRTVTARDIEGNVQFFGTYDGTPLVPGSANAEMNTVAQHLKQLHPDWIVTTGVKAEQAWKLYTGLNLEALQNFLDFIDPETKAELERDKTIQEFLRNAVNNRSVLKRMIHRSGMPGFSNDVTRTLASFITSNARHASSMFNVSDALKLVEEVPSEQGDIKDEAANLVDYVTKPGEEAAKLRSFLFFNFLGGSVAAAAVNLTQTVMMTLPYLAQHTSVANVTKAAIAASKMAVRDPETIEGERGRLLKQAEAAGITAPQQMFHLIATASNNPFSSNRSFRSFMTVWGGLFSTAEVFNRRVAFLSALDVAEGKGLKGEKAYKFAEQCVVETQGLYNKGNRPNWSRGTAGALVFTFKTFSIMYIELARRLPMEQRLLMLGILLVVAGGEGLPFEEDIADLVDTLGQWLGFTTNTGKWTGKVIADTLGKDFERPLLKGLGGMLPIDLHSRLGFDNLIPGTAFLKPSAIDKTRDVAEAVGPIGSVLQNLSRSLMLLARGRWDQAAVQSAPKAARDAYNGFHMIATGESMDPRGRLAMQNVTGAEAFGKAIGFNPQRASIEGEAKREIMADRNLRIVRMDEIAGDVAEAVLRKDKKAYKEAMDRYRTWNADNPSLRIDPRQLMNSVRERVRAHGQTSQQRFMKSVPKPMKRDALDALG